MSEVTCFVAYPSSPSSLVESIEEAINEINQGKVVHVEGWELTSVGGKFIIAAICHSIEQKNVFICDLTNLNHNVLFELGFAISRNKRIWIIINPSIEKSMSDFEKFNLLSTIGYAQYHNSRDIVGAFYKDQPYKDLENTIYKQAIESNLIGLKEKAKILYLKSFIETNASIKISRRIENSAIPNIVDDPREIVTQTLSWYAQEVYSAFALVVHMLAMDNTGWRLHNAKNSFVAGLAYGLGKHLLILAPEPYESPIDYRDILRIHKTALQCEKVLNEWLSDVEQAYKQRSSTSRLFTEQLRARTELQSIKIGDPVAEHEPDSISDYFIQTSSYEEAINSRHTLFIGRKGTGKTANLYKLAQEIGSDARNHVCIIKPIAFELQGILTILRKALPKSEKGYLIESFWKFLIYTELAKSVYEELKFKPSYYQPDKTEQDLIEFVEQNAPIITPEFSIRLESAVTILQDIETNTSALSQRTKISELLHDEMLSKMRILIGNLLEKKTKVAILVDNLDKAWERTEEIEDLSKLLLGLLGVSFRTIKDYQKSDQRRRPVNLYLTIFLRSDIFSRILKYAREKDKIPYSLIIWDDRDLLIRVLEERFMASSDKLDNSEEIWSRLFCPSINGRPIRSYMIEVILPRPRDLIYFAKAALARAINRGHTKVEEEDILSAEKVYSQYALDSLAVENGFQIGNLETLLYEFVGSTPVIGTEEIIYAMKNCGMSEDSLEEVIEVLFEFSFLGVEVEEDRFEFLYNEQHKPKLKAMARKRAKKNPDGLRKFIINRPFHAYLEIK